VCFSNFFFPVKRRNLHDSVDVKPLPEDGRKRKKHASKSSGPSRVDPSPPLPQFTVVDMKAGTGSWVDKGMNVKIWCIAKTKDGPAFVTNTQGKPVRLNPFSWPSQ
jgi:hypothetical protein